MYKNNFLLSRVYKRTLIEKYKSMSEEEFLNNLPSHEKKTELCKKVYTENLKEYENDYELITLQIDICQEIVTKKLSEGEIFHYNENNKKNLEGYILDYFFNNSTLMRIYHRYDFSSSDEASDAKIAEDFYNEVKNGLKDIQIWGKCFITALDISSFFYKTPENSTMINTINSTSILW